MLRGIGSYSEKVIGHVLLEDDRMFTELFSGDGSTTTFRGQARRLGMSVGGLEVMASAGSAGAAAGAPMWAEYDAGSEEAVFHFASAPPSGTDNVRVHYRLRSERFDWGV
jgi:hypothetical protein